MEVLQLRTRENKGQIKVRIKVKVEGRGQLGKLFWMFWKTWRPRQWSMRDPEWEGSIMCANVVPGCCTGPPHLKTPSEIT